MSLGHQGWLTIPAPLRRVLKLEEGDRLVASPVNARKPTGSYCRSRTLSKTAEGTLYQGARRKRYEGCTDQRTARPVLHRRRKAKKRVMTVVLYALDVLAYLSEEAGTEGMDKLLANARIASVNWAGVVQKLLSTGLDMGTMQENLQALGMFWEPFLPVDGKRHCRLWPLTREQRLSQGGRVCQSLGLRMGKRW